MFAYSKFSKNLVNWKHFNADIKDIFKDSPAPIPYWAQFKDISKRARAIHSFHMEKQKN